MDQLTFWDHVVQHTAWPFVVLVGLLVQHKAVGGLIKSISELKAKWGDKEVSVGTRKLEANSETVDRAEAVAAEKTPQLPAPDPAPEVTKPADEQLLIEPPKEAPLKLQAKQRLKFRDAVYSAPPVVIERAWQDVRNSVYKLLGIDKTAETWWDLDGMPDERLIAKLKADPRVDAELLKAIVELKMIRNDAITTIGWQPTTHEGKWYLENAERVVGLIDMAASKKLV